MGDPEMTVGQLRELVAELDKQEISDDMPVKLNIYLDDDEEMIVPMRVWIFADKLDCILVGWEESQ